MVDEAKMVLDAIAALDAAAEGDSNDAEIDAASGTERGRAGSIEKGCSAGHCYG